MCQKCSPATTWNKHNYALLNRLICYIYAYIQGDTMRKVLNTICLIILFASTIHSQNIKVRNPVARAGWELTFSDEFNGNELDKEKWITWFPYTNDGSDQCSFCRTHGDEGQIFLDRNVILNEGMLNIIAKRESATWFDLQRDHTSGIIHSRSPFGQGRYEIRCKFPPGKGFWPALWTFGQISAEVDIMEGGMQNPKRYHTSVHNWLIKKMAHKRNNVKTDITKDFHVYSMEWDSTYIKFFFDDKEVWTLCKYANRRGKNPRNCKTRPRQYTLQPVFPPDNEKLYLIVGMGVGNQNTPFTKSPDEVTKFPALMEVDYIRIYQRK